MRMKLPLLKYNQYLTIKNLVNLFNITICKNIKCSCAFKIVSMNKSLKE